MGLCSDQTKCIGIVLCSFLFYSAAIIMVNIIVFKMMLGTFPKAFSQAATSQGYFPKQNLPNCAISQAASSQAYPSHIPRPHIMFQPQRSVPQPKNFQPNLRGVAAWEIAQLRNCHLGNCHLGSRPWENTLKKGLKGVFAKNEKGLIGGTTIRKFFNPQLNEIFIIS